MSKDLFGNEIVIEEVEEVKEKKVSPFDLAHDLTSKERYDSEASEMKSYTKFLINRTLSYHYDILEFKDELYSKYRDKRQEYIDNIKIGKTNDALSDKREKVERYDKDVERKYIQEVLKFYQTCMHNVLRSDVSEELKSLQVKNLKKEMSNYQKYPTYGSVDVFQKHKDFSRA